MADTEKQEDGKYISSEVHHLERRVSQESDLSNQAHIDAFTPEEQKKLIRRIDRRLVLTCGFMYCVSLMDRTNLGIAAVGGMYVGMCRSLIVFLRFALTCFLRSRLGGRISIQYNHAGFLHHLCCPPATSHRRAPQSGPTSLLAIDHHSLGYDGHVLWISHELDPNDRSAPDSRNHGSWFLPR